MTSHTTRPFRVPRAHAPATMGEHYTSKTIGRLLLIPIAVLVVCCIIMLSTGQMVKYLYEQETAEAEHIRAANSIDLLVSQSGPLTPAEAEIIGRLAGLKDAHLSATAPVDPGQRMIPLLRGQTASGNYLVWTANSFGDEMFWTFAPVRLPAALFMLLMVTGIMIYLRRLVAELERQRCLAHRQSRTDVLTGLNNRLAFEAAMADLTAARTPFGLVIVDLDLFKAVNDALGHAAGDSVLRTVGQRLQDLMGPHDHLARLGGDEFVILRVNHPDHDALSALAHALIFAVEQPIEVGGRSVQVGASLGIVAAVTGDLPADTVLGAADSALYRAKSRPGSSFEFAGEGAEPANVWQLRCA